MITSGRSLCTCKKNSGRSMTIATLRNEYVNGSCILRANKKVARHAMRLHKKVCNRTACHKFNGMHDITSAIELFLIVPTNQFSHPRDSMEPKNGEISFGSNGSPLRRLFLK